MYPNFEEIAKEEGLKEIARLFKAIGKVEVEHEKEYLELKQALIDEGFFDSEDRITSYNVCYTKLLRFVFALIVSVISSSAAAVSSNEAAC